MTAPQEVREVGVASDWLEQPAVTQKQLAAIQKQFYVDSRDGLALLDETVCALVVRGCSVLGPGGPDTHIGSGGLEAHRVPSSRKPELRSSRRAPRVPLHVDEGC